jgi:putative photosynthetic complex assembly protein
MSVTRDEKIPKVLLRAVITLVVCVLILVTYARVTDRPLEAQPPDGAIVAERVIKLESTVTGAARILDQDGLVIAEFESGSGGFVSTIDRVVRRERLRNGVASDGVVHLRMREGGRISIFDPSTDRETELEAFGRDNIRHFENLLR